MAGRLTEEKITKLILIWLEANGWKIICFDFPQSGTGVILHPNSEIRESTKNKGSIIPDIVAVRGNIAVFFENKDRFVFSDFEKMNALKITTDYSNAISDLLRNYQIENIFYGIGLPNYVPEKRFNEHLQMIDFLILVDDEKQIEIKFQREIIF